MLPDSRSLWLHTTGDCSRSHAAWVTAISRARSSRSHFSNAACLSGSSNLSPRASFSLHRVVEHSAGQYGVKLRRMQHMAGGDKVQGLSAPAYDVLNHATSALPCACLASHTARTTC